MIGWNPRPLRSAAGFARRTMPVWESESCAGRSLMARSCINESQATKTFRKRQDASIHNHEGRWFDCSKKGIRTPRVLFQGSTHRRAKSAVISWTVTSRFPCPRCGWVYGTTCTITQSSTIVTMERHTEGVLAPNSGAWSRRPNWQWFR